MRPDFVFRGMTPYFRDMAAGSMAPLGERYVSAAMSLAPVHHVGQALAQASLADPGDRGAIFLAALPWRETLVLALAGVDAAIADVRSELGLSSLEDVDHGIIPMRSVMKVSSRRRGQ